MLSLFWASGTLLTSAQVFVTIVAGGLVGQFAGEPIGRLMTGLGTLINNATALSPVPMGIVVSTVMGLALTESTAIYGFVTALIMIFTLG